MWLLLAAACTPPPPPHLALPALPVAAGEAVNVDRFLSATPLGAKDALLCPWFRGEAVPDASLARWTTEARLAWLVLDVTADGATLAARTDVAARAREAREAAATLAQRCGGERAVDVLVLAGPETRRETVDAALAPMREAGFGEVWVAVGGNGAAGGDGAGSPGAARRCIDLVTTPAAPWTALLGATGATVPAGSVPLHGTTAAVPLRLDGACPGSPAIEADEAVEGSAAGG